jgi:hypothetical protein
MALVLERTIPTELTPLVGEVSAKFCWQRVLRRHPYGRILSFLDLSPYYFFQVAPQLRSRG